MKHNFKGSILFTFLFAVELTKIRIVLHLKLSKQPNKHNFICIVDYKHLIMIVCQNVKILRLYFFKKSIKVDRECKY